MQTIDDKIEELDASLKRAFRLAASMHDMADGPERAAVLAEIKDIRNRAAELIDAIDPGLRITVH